MACIPEREDWMTMWLEVPHMTVAGDQMPPTDNATYMLGSNGLPSTGIPYVLVNGTVMVRDSKVIDGVYPGQPIRYPMKEKGRWVPLEKKSYLENLVRPDQPFDDGISGQY